MRIVVPGGTGQLGQVLRRSLEADGHEVLVIGRGVPEASLRWDGRTGGAWEQVIDGADAVVNLAGRSVNCRYHWQNLNLMLHSRVDSALAVGRAIAKAKRPPAVWLQASTASIYAHTYGPAHTEAAGTLGGHEPDAPAYWGYSVSIARAWELALHRHPTPHTRKVALRTGFTMSPDRDGVFDWLLWLVRRGLGGPFLGGRQYVSWIHDADLCGAIRFAIDNPVQGPLNLTAPQPLPNAAFMAQLRQAAGQRFGVPILPGMAQMGAWMLGTDVELMAKSRRVVPAALLDAGYTFAFPTWEPAARDLVARWA